MGKHGTVGGYTNDRCRCDDCREAMQEYQRKWRAANPERYKAIQNRHAQSERRRAGRKAWREQNRDRIRARERERIYGLSDDEYQAMLAAQDGRCAICRAETNLHVDHCHDSGRVRGLLCPRCNTALGLLADDTARFRAAIAYLDGE